MFEKNQFYNLRETFCKVSNIKYWRCEIVFPSKASNDLVNIVPLFWNGEQIDLSRRDHLPCLSAIIAWILMILTAALQDENRKTNFSPKINWRIERYFEEGRWSKLLLRVQQRRLVNITSTQRLLQMIAQLRDDMLTL